MVTVQVSTHEWLLSLFAGRSFAWYLRRVYTALETLHREHGPVSLVAHSQGGVLALICIGPQTYDGKLLFPHVTLAFCKTMSVGRTPSVAARHFASSEPGAQQYDAHRTSLAMPCWGPKASLIPQTESPFRHVLQLFTALH